MNAGIYSVLDDNGEQTVLQVVHGGSRRNVFQLVVLDGDGLSDQLDVRVLLGFPLAHGAALTKSCQKGRRGDGKERFYNSMTPLVE